MEISWRRRISVISAIILIVVMASAVGLAERGWTFVTVATRQEMEEPRYLDRILGFLWQADGSGYQHVWPPMNFGWQIIVGSLIGFFGAAFGSVGGVGGGGIFVPMLTLIIGFDPKSSTAISKCMITGAAGSTVYYNLRLRHPTLDAPLIDYDLALLFQPMLLLGISIGVIFNVVFADWMVTVLLIIIFLVTSTKAFMKGVETWKKETIMKKEALRHLEGNVIGLQEVSYKPLPSEPGNTGQMEPKDIVDREFPIMENVSWKELCLLLFGMDGFPCNSDYENCVNCTASYKNMFNMIPVSLGVGLYEAVRLYKGRRVIASKGGEITVWKIHQLVIYCFLGIIAGIVGGLLGLGGGFVLSPLFLELGIPPQASSATATFAMTFSASMSVVEYYLLKRFPVPYALYFVAVAAIAAFVGQHVVRKLILLMGRASLIIFILASTIFVSAISLGGVGVSNMVWEIQHGEYMGFDNLCK
ncbi:hypothetical protein HPP92_007788 [Vanilla planifolia]|uniref:Sulfite exporter TauE/SafE family protein n=1 Tax=Vanilla planifolia TaxID=51239 RepID=A0A835V850_VANPL|nr:hypothetical protein HPP92_007788 [Vanilla planifolia]